MSIKTVTQNINTIKQHFAKCLPFLRSYGQRETSFSIALPTSFFNYLLNLPIFPFKLNGINRFIYVSCIYVFTNSYNCQLSYIAVSFRHYIAAHLYQLRTPSFFSYIHRAFYPDVHSAISSKIHFFFYNFCFILLIYYLLFYLGLTYM